MNTLELRNVALLLFVPMQASRAHTSGQLVIRPSPAMFDGVQVFSATMVEQRQSLGENVSAWIAEHSELEVTEFVVTQSSDAAFHCITITVFYRQTRVPS